MLQVALSGGEVRVVEVPEPVVRPGTVRVRTSHSLISAGTESAGIGSGGRPESLVIRAIKNPALVKKVVERVRYTAPGRQSRARRARVADPTNPLRDFLLRRTRSDEGECGDPAPCHDQGDHLGASSSPRSSATGTPPGSSRRPASRCARSPARTSARPTSASRRRSGCSRAACARQRNESGVARNVPDHRRDLLEVHPQPRPRRADDPRTLVDGIQRA